MSTDTLLNREERSSLPTTTRTDELVEACERLTKLGWLVFPAANKKPLTPNGFYDASSNMKTIRRWWEQHPDAQVAVRTGATTDTAVIDVDPRHAGHLALSDLEAEHNRVPDTVESITGSGGRHLFYAYPGGDLRSGVDVLGPGIDIRANGGYVIVPPSLHESGQYYEWEAASDPWEAEIVPFPAWALDLIAKSKAQPAPVAHPRTKSDRWNIPSIAEHGADIGGERVEPLISGLARLAETRGFDVDLDFAHHLGLPTDGLWTEKRGTKAFWCVIPGHGDKQRGRGHHKSASLFRTDSGDILYRDWHGNEQWFTLPEVYASLCYGHEKKFSRVGGGNPGAEHATWRFRLLYEVKRLTPAPVPHRPLPDNVGRTVKAVYAGLVLHVGLRWRVYPHSAVTFSARFASAYCGVSQTAVTEAMKYLFANKYVKGVGSVPSRFGKQTWLLWLEGGEHGDEDRIKAR
jgi:hypothetical protein